MLIIDVDGACLIVNNLKKVIVSYFNFRQKVTACKFSTDDKFIAVA